jgi:predicted N-acetyltransferase YhbS
LILADGAMDRARAGCYPAIASAPDLSQGLSFVLAMPRFLDANRCPPENAIDAMNDLSLTILPETLNDAQAIERLHERTFGPGRFVLSAYRLREHVDHLLDLSFTARIGTLLVGSVRQLPICIGDAKALLLGPLTIEPPFRKRGVGRALLERALADAKAKGHRLVLLVGDEAYYSRVGFRRVPKASAIMPGPVDHDRLLIAELADGAFEGVSGAIRPDWSMVR